MFTRSSGSRMRRGGGNNEARRMIHHEATRHRVAAGQETFSPLIESLERRKMELLPGTAEDVLLHHNEDEGTEQQQEQEHRNGLARQGYPVRNGWEPILQTILKGTRETNQQQTEKSPITMLRNHEDTLVPYILSFSGHPWMKHVKLTVPAALVGSATYDFGRMQFDHGRTDWSLRRIVAGVPTTSSGYDDGFVSFAKVGQVTFPEPNERNVNMMPFILGDKNSLPADLQCYHHLVEQCPYSDEERGKVGYLTVHESYVDVGEAQRREGLHIEAGQIGSNVSKSVNDEDQNNKKDNGKINFTPAREHAWGMGMFYGNDNFEGGIYMASSVANTSQVWDALVDNRVPGIVDKHGGCEHLRDIIGVGTMLGAGELIWMTDLTPHEAVPQTTSGRRQFFRVVGPCISHWYEQHSTKNPNVPLPNHVQIIKANKFLKTVGEKKNGDWWDMV